MKPRENRDGIRAFIALDLSNEAKDALEEIQKRVRQLTAPKSIRWVKRPAFHLTLAFLGDGVLPEQITMVSEALSQVGPGQPPMTLSLGVLGCFPEARKPRVIWVGVGGELGRLNPLKLALDQALEPLGWRPEQRLFNPHLTLGRVNDPLGVANHDLPYGEILQEVTWSVRAVHLYHSQLAREGARYTKVHTSPLSGAD